MLAFRLGPKQQSRKGRAERERIERREHYRHRDGQRELLIEPSRDAGDQGGRYEHRRQDQSNANDWPGELFHRL
jgi:hypothetical protein